jgi:hypothetical protein
MERLPTENAITAATKKFTSLGLRRGTSPWRSRKRVGAESKI